MKSLLLAVALAACSGGHTAPAHPQTGSAAASGSAAPPITGERDCNALIAHAVALGIGERADGSALSDADRLAVETDLRTRLAPECRQLAADRFDCAMRASSLDDLTRCDEERPRDPSSP